MDATQRYRKHGALLSMGSVGAAFLAGRGLALPDPMGNKDGLVGMNVPGDKIDCYISDTSTLRLIGGVMVERDDEVDAIIGVCPIDIKGVFDDEEA